MRTLLLFLLCAFGVHGADSSDTFISKYRPSAEKIISAATNSTVAWERLAYFCDHFPARLSGSANLEAGIDWMLEKLRQDGFENVHAEEVQVPHWVRGAESALAMQPVNYKLHMLGLGGSIGTPEEGITAEVLTVKNFEELRSRTNEAKGKIVLFNLPFTGYGETVYIRSRGAIEAGKAGAVASLIRSVTPYSMRTPHTGAMKYDDAVRKIPHAAISPEDADWIARAQARGEKVIVNLKMSARTLPPARSRNVIAEFRGTDEPEKYFLLSAHLDSWDVGQGAMDDGGGCLAVWEACRVLKTLNLRPKRSLRMVFYTNEENGLEGARQYFARHTDEIGNYIMAFESDEGVFQPRAFKFTGPEHAKGILREILSLLEPIGANKLDQGSDSSDLIYLRDAKVPSLDLIVEGSKYFWFHHTDADTLDKLTPLELNRCAAAIAVVAFSYADYLPGPR